MSADVIVADLVMPEADGVWLLEQVNGHPRAIPVIVVSGFAEEQVSRLAETPFARKLLKPVDPRGAGRHPPRRGAPLGTDLSQDAASTECQ